YPPNTGGNPPGYCEQRNQPEPELFPGFTPQALWECVDGYVSYRPALPGIGGRTHQEVMRWAEAEGAVPDDLCGINWLNWIEDVVNERLSVETVARSCRVVADFFKTKTKQELQAFAAQKG